MINNDVFGVEKEKINMLMMNVPHLSLQETVRAMKIIRDLLDDVKSVKAMLEKAHDKIRLEHVPAKMETEGVERVSYADIGRVGLTADLYASIQKDRKGDAYEWLKDHGHGDLIKPTLNASTLKALAKEMIKAGSELPDDLFNITPFTRASITKN